MKNLATLASILTALGLSAHGCDRLRARRDAPVDAPAAAPRGTGAFSLERPAAHGAVALQQHLVVTTRSAAGQTTRAEHTRLYLSDARVRSEVETVDQDGRPVRVMAAREGRAVYVRAGDGRCTGELRGDAPTEAMQDPAAMLPPVRGATAAGDESLNGEPTKKYTFDQRAVTANPAVRAQGAVWIAVRGSWVARYELRATDASGERAWAYTASRADANAAVRPDGCGAVLEDVAAMPGATDEARSSGSLSYQTARPIAEARAFNAQTLGAMGYQQRAAMLDTPAEQIVLFAHDASRRLAMLSLRAEGAATRVLVQVAEPPTDAAIASAPAPQQSAPTLPPAVAALARFLPDTLGGATARDAPNGTSTTLFGMRTTMAMRNYRASGGSLRVMLSQGDVARLSRSNLATGPTPREIAAGARATTLVGQPAVITVEGAEVKLKCVLDGGVLVDLVLDGPGAAGAETLLTYANALDLAALRRVR